MEQDQRIEANGLTVPAGFTLGPCIGGMSGRTLVFAGVDASGQPCALKTIDPTVAGAALVQARFAAERTLHDVANGCANVLPLVGPQPDAWLITAWAHTGDLGAWLDVHPRTQSAYTAQMPRVVTALLRACAALHALGIVHRDIKASNVLLDGDDVWLADFGLAARREADGVWRALPPEWTETSIGSPDWAAPELLLPAPQSSPANDVFGVGKVWHALAARGANEPAGHAALRAQMLHADPATRPTIPELLAAFGV